MENPRQSSIFVRCLITALCALLVAMIVFRYIAVEPKGEINSGIITLIIFLIVLVLAESFDNFSIGKLITISREAKKKEKEVDKLERQNAQLLSQILSVTNTNTQNQNHTNVYGDYHASTSVEKATDSDVQESHSADVAPPSASECSGAPRDRERLNLPVARKIALDKYFTERSINTFNVIYDVKLVSRFKDIDPISNYQPIFNAYFNNDETEVFVDVRLKRYNQIFLREQLYIMLSKIHHYRITKCINARLELLLITMPNTEEERLRNNRMLDRTLEWFEPAIASGILKIHEVEFSEEDKIASYTRSDC